VRTIGVVTGARSDYGLLVPVLRAISADSMLRLQLFVTGMHLSPDFGLTVREVERDFEITERVEMLVASDTPEAISKSVGLGVIGFAQTYTRHRPDILLVLGDRFETLAAVAAALPFTIPVAHISGGEATEGAIDDAIRHSITKMSHLHFVAMEEYRRRVIQMGEEPWRVTVSGEPGLDHVTAVPQLSLAKLEAQIGMTLEPAPLLVTFHPATLELGQTEMQTTELLAALDTVGISVVFTAPNADTEGRIIAARIQDFVAHHPNSRYVANLGTTAYLSMMHHCAAMVGNSSSGIVEAASFQLPVVDVGSRQRGRIHAANVIHSELKAEAVVRAIRLALSPDFRQALEGLRNPYGDGKAAHRIVQVLKTVPLDRHLLVKTFHTVGQVSSYEEVDVAR
jgi:UDP-hydrolysing UDP-N-acetyl-D-glucosamine 2-epimerase